MMTEFSNHRLFDRQGRRLAIFGRVEDGMLEMFVLTCSKHDMFSRKLARKIWNGHLEKKELTIGEVTFKPLIYSIPLTLPSQPKNSFLRHCNDTYQKAYPVYTLSFKYRNDVEADIELFKQVNSHK